VDKKILASADKRPDHSKYGHNQIKGTLLTMSFHKCFYCERKLKGVYSEIDHFIEVSDPKGYDLAFDWNNLFLACDNCNNKHPNNTIPVSKVLNPCLNSDEEIQSHLGFEDEFITSKNNSVIGLLTIKKFRLDNELLDYLRLKQLSYFKDVLLQIRKNQLEDNRKTMTKIEKESLILFSQPDHPFSLMFKTILTKYGIIENQ